MNETQPSALVESDQPDELSLTWAWRFEQFAGLGFDSAAAGEMADDSLIDLAQARRLVGLGCPLETATRILI